MKGSFKLYGRPYCHLCEEMAGALRAAGVDFEEIDVDSDPALEARYGEDVPVLVREGVEVCRHRLTAQALAKLR